MSHAVRARAPRRSAARALAALLVLLHAGAASAQRRRHRQHPRGRPTTSAPVDTDSGSGSGDASGSEGEGAATSGAQPPPGGTTGSRATSDSGSTSSSSAASSSSASSSSASSSSRAPRPAALDLAIGGRVFGRFLSYHDDLFNVMRPYELSAGPMLSAALEWYPGAHASAGPAAWFGLTGSIDYAVLVSSERRSDHATFGTTAYRWTAGVRVRVPFGNGSDVGLGVAWAQQRYAIAPTMASMSTPPTANDTGVPAVDYGSVRVYASSRLALGDRFALLLGVGYLVVLSTGEMGAAAYFPRATVTTLEASLGVALRLVGGLELRLGADMHRYGWAMNPNPGDPFIVGGAADQYYSAWALLALRL